MQVDLGTYAGSQVIIRFRLRSDAAYPYDGWGIDDVEIKELGAVALGYPFFDNMDTDAPLPWWQRLSTHSATIVFHRIFTLFGHPQEPTGYG